jgi:hypothetical protein
MTACLHDPKRHLLVTDNWFTTLAVVRYCSSIGLDFIGAMKARSGVPAEVLWQKSKKLQEGSANLVCHKTDDIKVQQWMDGNVVSLLMTNCVRGARGSAPQLMAKAKAAEADVKRECAMKKNPCTLPTCG